ncbi:MAG: low molecular weight protein arginine phosphatase [Bacillota bacterium]|nr:low molecular weight protein arginine phosphatase [Bacillota bacterium]
MNILFVCAGNTCRSCMAEAIFNHINDCDRFKALSAGVSAAKGSCTSKNAAGVVEYNAGLDISKRAAVQLTEELIRKAQLVLAMTRGIKNHVAALFPDCKDKVFTLNEYVGVKGEISDPYGGDISVYNNTFIDLTEKIKLLLLKLKEDSSI